MVAYDCHKFRTMTVRPTPNPSLSKEGNSQNWSTVSVAGDSRITPFGATLRHYKIDELPGLWDVLVGNMSFVGPRPDVPGYADKLQGDARDVLNPDKVRLNCYYYRHYSFVKDIQMILCTVLGKKMKYAGEVI